MSDTLGQFIAQHREELLRRCRADIGSRSDPPPSDSEIERGIPRFLDDIVAELSDGPSRKLRMDESATQRGADLFSDGFTVGQVVHDYGAICQSITGLAVEFEAPISADDFRTLNRCLDDSIANAVSEYTRQQQDPNNALNQSMTLRNLVVTALHGFEVLQSGTIGVDGSTGRLVHRCLESMVKLTSSVVH